MLLRRFSYLLLLVLLLAMFGTRAAVAQQKGPDPLPQAATTLRGALTIVWGDPSSGAGQAQIKLYLTDSSGARTEIRPLPGAFDETGGPVGVNGRPVVVAGAFDTTAVAGDEPPVFVARSVILAGGQAAGPQPITGPQPWVSILCKFNNVAAEPKPLSYFSNMYGATYPGLNHYWKEASYNLININGSAAFGWFTLPRPRSAYFNSNGSANLDLLARDCTAAADAAVYFPTYVGINMMFNDNLDCCAWGGGWYGTLDGQFRLWRMTWEPPWGYSDIAVMAHEMGHGFGMPHSSGMYGETYDNRWDVMSDLWTDCDRARHATFGCLGQGTIGYHKELAGWIAAARRYTATTGEQTIALERLAQPSSSGYLIAQIPINGSSDHYYTVEARRWTGYDAKLPLEGVVIHEILPNRDRPAQVVDVDGDGDTGDSGAQWLPGETFNPGNGISVRVDSATATGYVVTIRLTPPVVDPHEPNNRRADATPIAYGTVLDDPLINPAGDLDYYRFSGQANDTIVVDIDARVNGSPLDSSVELITDSGALLASNDDDGSTLDSYLTYRLTAAGTYYIKVKEYSHPNVGGPDFSYTLKFGKTGGTGAQVFVTTAAAGTTADGVSFDKRDILRWNGTRWSLFFDGSARGLPDAADISAIRIPDPTTSTILMSFLKAVTLPGVGKVLPHDVVLYNGSAYFLHFDGSRVGLTTTGERIDAMHRLEGSASPIGSNCQRYFLISTTGSGSVPKYNGGTLTFSGEDVLGFCATGVGSSTAGLWHKVLDGSDEGLPAGATFSLSSNANASVLYLTTKSAFSADGVSGGHSMVYKFDKATGRFSGPYFRAMDHGLAVKVDGLEMVGTLP